MSLTRSKLPQEATCRARVGLWDRAGCQSLLKDKQDTAEEERGPQQSLEKCPTFPVRCLRVWWSFSPRWSLTVVPVSLWNLCLPMGRQGAGRAAAHCFGNVRAHQSLSPAPQIFYGKLKAIFKSGFLHSEKLSINLLVIFSAMVLACYPHIFYPIVGE